MDRSLASAGSSHRLGCSREGSDNEWAQSFSISRPNYSFWLAGLAYDREHGLEPWVTDGTPDGTRILKDLDPGPSLSGPTHPVNVNATLYFFDSRSGHSDLWVTGGTEQTTMLLQSGFQSVTEAVALNGMLLFLESGGGLHTLWKSDGTPTGAMRIQTFARTHSFLYPAGKYAYFPASNGTASGVEPWRTDGTPEGTVLVRDIYPGTESSDPFPVGMLDGHVFVYANDGVHGRELWVTDGTHRGTRLVRDLRPGAAGGAENGNFMARIGQSLYFRSNDGVHGDELWSTDGTAAGTRMVRDIRPGNMDSYPHHLVEFNNVLYFGAGDGVHGSELWRSDGTSAGTQLVKDLLPGKKASYPQNFKQAGSNLYFSAGTKLWITNGTPAGTRSIQKPLSLRYCYERNSCDDFTLHRLNQAIVFAAFDPFTGVELWRSDSTNAGTRRLKDIARGNAGTNLELQGSVNGQLVFLRRGQDFRRAIYASDGTAAGTREIVPADVGSAEISGGILWYGTRIGETYTYELWRTDLTPNGTFRIPGVPDSGDGSTFSTLGAVTLFRHNGHTLWRTDAIPGGTKPLQTLEMDGSYAFITNIVATRAHWMILARTDSQGFGIWKSDGTPEGTAFVQGFSGYLGDFPEITALGPDVLFGFQGSARHQLWASNGTSAGTRQLLSVRNYGTTIEALTPAGSLAFFRVYTRSAGTELWKTDGTPNGTVMVKDILQGAVGSSPELLTPAGNILYFHAADKLWRTDGTSQGTTSVSDTVHVGSREFDSRMGVFNGQIVFAGREENTGTELWISDGTPSGTRILQDILPGPYSSNPGKFVPVSNRLFFVADDGIRGDELWKLDP